MTFAALVTLYMIHLCVTWFMFLVAKAKVHKNRIMDGLKSINRKWSMSKKKKNGRDPSTYLHFNLPFFVNCLLLQTKFVYIVGFSIFFITFVFFEKGSCIRMWSKGNNSGRSWDDLKSYKVNKSELLINEKQTFVLVQIKWMTACLKISSGARLVDRW